MFEVARRRRRGLEGAKVDEQADDDADNDRYLMARSQQRCSTIGERAEQYGYKKVRHLKPPCC